MYKALKSFCGKVSMHKDETRELTDKAVISDLVRAGYIEEVQPAKKSKKGDAKNDDC